MALQHAQALDVIPLRPLGPSLATAASTSLLKTQRIQLLHLVLPAHHAQPDHRVDDECVIHCIEGDVAVVMREATRELKAGDIVVLPAGMRHALHARVDSAVLVTLLLHGGDAGDHGAPHKQ